MRAVAQGRGQRSATSWTPAARDACALTLLALVVNLVHLGSKSIVHDEAGSVLYARLSPGALLHALVSSDLNMTLYYVLLNFWVGIFGESEVAARAPSALFGALAVGAIYLLGSRLFGRIGGIVAGLLLALNAFMVQFAQTARSYSLLVFLVTLSSFFLVREIEQPSKGNRIGYVVASVLAVYAHYFAFYVLAAHMLTLLASRRTAALTREWFGVAAAILLLSAPTALIVYRSGAARRFNWIGPPSLTDVPSVIADLTGNSRVLLYGLLVGGCWATAHALWERRAWPHVFVAMWLIVPLALSFLVSLVLPMFLSYYLIVCLPALILFGVAGIASLRPPVLAGAVVALLLGVCATRLFAYYHEEAAQNWRAAARYVLASIRAGDGVVYFPDTAVKPFGYYARQDGVAVPANLDAQPLVGKERIWFVIRESDVAGMRPKFLELESRLTESFRLEERRRFGWVGVDLYVR